MAASFVEPNCRFEIKEIRQNILGKFNWKDRLLLSPVSMFHLAARCPFCPESETNKILETERRPHIPQSRSLYFSHTYSTTIITSWLPMPNIEERRRQTSPTRIELGFVPTTPCDRSPGRRCHPGSPPHLQPSLGSAGCISARTQWTQRRSV